MPRISMFHILWHVQRDSLTNSKCDIFYNIWDSKTFTDILSGNFLRYKYDATNFKSNQLLNQQIARAASNE